MSKSKNECRNLYLVDLEIQLFWVFALNQAEALKIVLEKEVNNPNEFEIITVSIVCCENDIVNLNNK